MEKGVRDEAHMQMQGWIVRDFIYKAKIVALFYERELGPVEGL